MPTSKPYLSSAVYSTLHAVNDDDGDDGDDDNSLRQCPTQVDAAVRIHIYIHPCIGTGELGTAAANEGRGGC